MGKHSFVNKLMMTLALLALSACSRSNNMQDLQQFVAEVKSRPGAEVEPVPQFEPYEAFSYSAASFRSPFERPIVVELDETATISQNVEPDLDRPREALEEFNLSELRMVGMMMRDNDYSALVQDETGTVHRIRAGNYLGRNHGRVHTITDTRMELTEIVPSGDGGWVERPQTLTLQ
ncbi:MAG: pilus assembly protein PilP [Pseudohongiellaceae bacterium]